MKRGLIEETTRWQRRGLAKPWLHDSFMADLSMDALERLESHASLHWMPERTIPQPTMSMGAPVLIVLDGAVKIFHLRRDGRHALVNVAGAGDVLNAEEFLIGAAAITQFTRVGNAVLLAIPCEKFRELLTCDEIQHALARTLARRVQALTIQHGHAGRPVALRLWAFLVHWARRHGRRIHDGRILLQVGLTQADLAAAVGASINSVEAAMRDLRIAGKLISGYAQVTLYELPTEDELDKSFSWVVQISRKSAAGCVVIGQRPARRQLTGSYAVICDRPQLAPWWNSGRDKPSNNDEQRKPVLGHPGESRAGLMIPNG